MVTPGDAILGLVDRFAQAKEDSLKLSIASKEASLAQDLTIRSQDKLNQDYENAPIGGFSSDDQLAWYDREVERLTNSITNEDQRLKFKNLLTENRQPLAIKANQYELASRQEGEVRAIQDRRDQFALKLTDPNVDPEELLVTHLLANKHYKEVSGRTAREALDTEDDWSITAALSTKVNRLKSAFALHKISREDFVTQVNELENRLSQSGLMETLSAEQRLNLKGTLETIKDDALVNGMAAKLINLENDNTGEIQRVKDGLEPNTEHFTQIEVEADADPENAGLRNLAIKNKILLENRTFYTDRRDGDLRFMTSEVNRLRDEIPNSSGKEYEIKKTVLNEMETELADAKALYVKNSAEFFKNNINVKQSLIDIAANPDDPSTYDNYVVNLLQLHRAQGGSDESVEILNDQQLSSYATQLVGLTPDQYEATILNVKEKFRKGVGNTTAGEIAIDQIAGTSMLNIAARYAGTASFNPIYKALNLDPEIAKQLLPSTDKASSKLQDAVTKAIAPHLMALIKRNPDDPAVAINYVRAAYRVALAAPLDPNSGVGVSSGAFFGMGGKNVPMLSESNFDEAAKYAVTHLFDKHSEVVDRDNGRITVSLPKNKPSVIKQTKAYFTSESTSSLIENAVLNKAKKLGGVMLRGDITSLIDTDAIPGLDLKSLDFQSMIEDASIVNGENGNTMQVNIKVDGVNIPLRLKSKDGTRSETVEFGLEEFNDLQRQSKEIRDNLFQDVPEELQEDLQDLEGTGRFKVKETTKSKAVFNDMQIKGNIDMSNRPTVKNSDGSVSTVRSITVETDGLHFVIPTVINGEVVTNEEAIAYFKETGKHLGAFKSAEGAVEYSQNLHRKEAKRLGL